MQLLLRDVGSEFFVSEAVFGSAFNESLIHQVITAHQSGARQGTRAQKNRSLVSGSGKKPWRQKGTGRARSGSIRSPIWRSGGVTFAAKSECHKRKVNRKMYRGALKSILSELVRQNRLIFVSEFFINEPKTKILIEKLKKIDVSSSNILIFSGNSDDRNLFLASRNLYRVEVRSLSKLNPFVLVSFDKVLMTVQFIKSLEDVLI